MRMIDQNNAIAVAIGWSHLSNANTMAASGIWIGYPPSGAIVGMREPIPNFCGDLNAMHEAEKLLRGDSKLWNAYTDALDYITAAEYGIVNATAPQKARAFLIAMELWEESGN